MSHSRDWLRGFLHLDARAEKDNIPQRDIERQEDTVLAALDLLETEPGVVLADEVGMGKTYEALGVIACVLRANPKARVVVITPGPDLTLKWKAEFDRFCDPKVTLYDFGDQVTEAWSAAELVSKVRSHPVVLAPVSVFNTTRGGDDQAYLLSLFFHWKGLHGHTANAILSRFRDGKLDRVDVTRESFLGEFGLDEVEPHLKNAFRSSAPDVVDGLDDLYSEGGNEAFEHDGPVRRALNNARFALLHGLLPDLDLLVVDEAHKLKNAGSVRSIAVSTIFKKKHNKTLFLTATPFQLSIAELQQVFQVFAHARSAPADLMERAGKLFSDIALYQAAYEVLQHAWGRLDAPAAIEFGRLFDADPTLGHPIDDPAFRVIAQHVREVRRLKDDFIEPGFRRWMIRSLREDKRQYRQHLRERLDPQGQAAIPFLLYERFIAELFRQNEPTHKAAVQVNMVSSYAAARSGALFQEERRRLPETAEPYRQLLGRVLEMLTPSRSEHPKLDYVLNDAIKAAQRNEKTLIFCTRTSTLTELSRQLDEAWEEALLTRWRKVYPDAKREDIFDETAGEERLRGRHTRLQGRFHRPQDTLYLALRERYLRTLAPAAGHAASHLVEVVAVANAKLRSLPGATVGKRTDYRIIKRCVEQAAVESWKDACPEEAALHATAVASICSPDFLRLGEGGTIEFRRPREDRSWLKSRERVLMTWEDGVLEGVISRYSAKTDRATVFVHDAEADEDDHYTVPSSALRPFLEAVPEPSVPLQMQEPESDAGMQGAWRITPEAAMLVIGDGPHLWEAFQPKLDQLDLELRATVVERLARYLTFKEVPFLAELLHLAHARGLDLERIESAEFCQLVDDFWVTRTGQAWQERIAAFLDYFTSRDEEQKRQILAGPIRTGNFVRHTADGESRERLREAFNTPLFPMVLVANEVMQEGLDLHRHCRRVVHHDLAWNPAQLEQRVGRVDRLGSLTHRLREIRPDTRLDILYPLIRRTIDERLNRTVKERERWLEFLLGAPPKFEEYATSGEGTSPLPETLSRMLAVRLQPERAHESESHAPTG